MKKTVRVTSVTTCTLDYCRSYFYQYEIDDLQYSDQRKQKQLLKKRLEILLSPTISPFPLFTRTLQELQQSDFAGTPKIGALGAITTPRIRLISNW